MDDVIKDYIFQCDEVLKSQDSHGASELINKIVGVFESQMKDIGHGLDSYTSYLGNHQMDYLGDIAVLKDRLISYYNQDKNDDEKISNRPGIDLSAIFQDVRKKVEIDGSLTRHDRQLILDKINEIDEIIAAK